MNWAVVDFDGFVYAQFYFSVDALQYKKDSPDYIRGQLTINKIGE